MKNCIDCGIPFINGTSNKKCVECKSKELPECIICGKKVKLIKNKFCSRECSRKGFLQGLSLQDRTCQNCSKEFQSSGSNRYCEDCEPQMYGSCAQCGDPLKRIGYGKFCSQKCANENKKNIKQVKNLIHICEICKQEYLTSTWNSKWCNNCKNNNKCILCGNPASFRHQYCSNTCAQKGTFQKFSEQSNKRLEKARAPKEKICEDCSTNYMGTSTQKRCKDCSKIKKMKNLRHVFQGWKHLVLERDNYKCVQCGSNKKLHVDHIKPRYWFPEVAQDIENGRVLCESCHYETPSFGAKSKTIYVQYMIQENLIPTDPIKLEEFNQLRLKYV